MDPVWLGVSAEAMGELEPLIRTEEQVHATLEFLGEVGELGTLLMQRGFGGPSAETRNKIVDEIGDVFFCGCWVLDAHGSEVLSRLPRLELLDRNDEELISGHGDIDRMKAELFQSLFAAGILANNMKKRRYHNVDIDSFEDRYRVMDVFVALCRLLYRLDSCIEAALLLNQSKIDRRFPNGWVAGGGNR